ncbi:MULTISPECIES: hypothetical protein [unclassified Butyrivibrio]|uniref:hypothetical protein n=1 Tax=unclassified Butyrivibrio TaxID=2639466 RepID=UPI0003B68E21|nr:MULTISPECIES: hypothetical protein [unclassified Butyrivibrio]SDB24588.1 hypothetical protein SAMN02910263_01187 [Butyrivibrio sp. INlla16]SEL19951.1 hypothetical protein SAMN04487770_10740 [Butyrivibrio sp. ob235]
MERYIASKRICDKNIDILKLDEETLAYMRDKDIETIRDFIGVQNKLKPKYADVVKKKIKYLIQAMERRGIK